MEKTLREMSGSPQYHFHGSIIRRVSGIIAKNDISLPINENYTGQLERISLAQTRKMSLAD
jgi:hypothetical protein